jgi:toxin secretion/phage lysis holin
MKVRKMKKMNYMDTYNAVTGSIIALLSLVFGEHWLLFAMFLLFNIIDWLTGWMKSGIANKTNSTAGWKGILKKLGYWLMILVSFAAAAVFIEIGNTIGVDLGITALLGYFVLASLLVNEIRSIIENFVEAGYNVPPVLTKGLEVADKIINRENQE